MHNLMGRLRGNLTTLELAALQVCLLSKKVGVKRAGSLWLF